MGNLVIYDVAAGAYIMHVWAIGIPDTTLATMGRRVSVSGLSLDLGTIELNGAVPAPQNKNKFGEDYEEKRPSSY